MAGQRLGSPPLATSGHISQPLATRGSSSKHLGTSTPLGLTVPLPISKHRRRQNRVVCAASSRGSTDSSCQLGGSEGGPLGCPEISFLGEWATGERKKVCARVRGLRKEAGRDVLCCRPPRVGQHPPGYHDNWGLLHHGGAVAHVRCCCIRRRSRGWVGPHVCCGA